MATRILTQYKFISQSSLNGHCTLFGGIAMKWLDEACYILATRFTRKKMVTAKVDRVKFLAPIFPGSIIEIRCEILKISTVCLNIKAEIFVEEMYSDKRQKALESYFLFAAIDEDNKPMRLNCDPGLQDEFLVHKVSEQL